jgi:hypothetical protein
VTGLAQPRSGQGERPGDPHDPSAGTDVAQLGDLRVQVPSDIPELDIGGGRQRSACLALQLPRENRNSELSSIMLALVHALNWNRRPVTFAGCRQRHPLACGSTQKEQDDDESSADGGRR